MPVSTTSTLPAGFDGHSQAAAIRVSPSGNWVFVSNRGVASDSVAVVRFDVDEGKLELAGLQSTYGRKPRELVFAGAGSRVIVANQDDDSLIVFAFDDSSGAHEQLSVNPVPTPVCVRGRIKQERQRQNDGEHQGKAGRRVGAGHRYKPSARFCV